METKKVVIAASEILTSLVLLEMALQNSNPAKAQQMLDIAKKEVMTLHESAVQELGID